MLLDQGRALAGMRRGSMNKRSTPSYGLHAALTLRIFSCARGGRHQLAAGRRRALALATGPLLIDSAIARTRVSDPLICFLSFLARAREARRAAGRR